MAVGTQQSVSSEALCKAVFALTFVGFRCTRSTRQQKFGVQYDRNSIG